MKHKSLTTFLKNTTVCILLSVYLCSCSELSPTDGRYWVRHVDEGLETSKYQLVPLKGFGTTWVEAERGLYHFGDTLVMGKPCR